MVGVDPHEFSPWAFWREADPERREAQLEHQRALTGGHAERRVGTQCFISELASVDHDILRLGDRTYIAAGAYLTGELLTGADCSINPYTVIRGRVAMGEAVRIGAHTSILGFNHSMDPGTPVFRQPLTSRGIVIGDDVWIGSHVVILDGVSVGSHSVLAAGAVVTKDVPAGAIVGGNPARFIRWRVEPDTVSAGPSSLGKRVAEFGARARSDASAILDRAWRNNLALFADHRGATPTVRAQADAIEIADLLLGTAPPQRDAAGHVGLLQGWQDAATGAVAPLGADGDQLAGLDFSHGDVAYHVLSAGYALDLLGSSFTAPLTWVTEATPEGIVEFCRRLPWTSDPWNAGHHIDGFGTALLWAKNAGTPVPEGVEEALFGWLLLNADPHTGMWGSTTRDRGMLPVVNGFYRASRGTFAQFGMPLPHPERVVDTVLTHARDPHWFAPGSRNACNVLDVAHPLWLTRSTGYRSDEVREAAEHLLSDSLRTWVPGAGFSFREPSAATRGLVETQPGLQGTEMWLAIVWYLADILGIADALEYRPRGVHRPEPAPGPGRT
ncbi:acyltransferase [Microbacterium sp. PMB16]|uniref:acyltransferase n=1 Tax=Microbacterium sp. PMB16 TaxID=3120157 RepID=UPI003F4CABAC